MTTRYYLPALRGRFGDWAYYAALMPLEKIAARIAYAEDIHGKGKLSRLIQRELKEGRAQEIADYLLSNSDRFFNSLVVAVYGGKPQWHPFIVKPMVQNISVDDLDATARDSVGYLSLTNDEQLFALDGQHRLAGIKQALSENPELGSDELSVIFVAHHNDEAGMRRTRKLFTTLNKQAKPVKKSEIIALDESDAVAIVTRHLVENHKYFNDEQIDILRKQPNLAHGDVDHFTTIINLYDTLDLVLFRIVTRLAPKKADKYKSFRPNDEEIADLIESATGFYKTLGKLFPDIGSYLKAHRRDRRKILTNMRASKSGHVLFRPIGMQIFCQILAAIRAKYTLNVSLNLLALLPTRLNKPPYAGTIWNSTAQTIDNKKRALCRDLLLYMLGHYPNKKTDSLLKKYAMALGKEPGEVELPGRVV